MIVVLFEVETSFLGDDDMKGAFNPFHKLFMSS